MTTKTLRTISDVKIRICEGECCVDTVIGDADVIAHVNYEPPILRITNMIATKPVTLYGEIGNYVIEAGVDIKDLLSIGKLREEEEAAQIDYERELEAQEVTC